MDCTETSNSRARAAEGLQVRAKTCLCRQIDRAVWSTNQRAKAAKDVHDPSTFGTAVVGFGFALQRAVFLSRPEVARRLNHGTQKCLPRTLAASGREKKISASHQTNTFKAIYAEHPHPKPEGRHAKPPNSGKTKKGTCREISLRKAESKRDHYASGHNRKATVPSNLLEGERLPLSSLPQMPRHFANMRNCSPSTEKRLGASSIFNHVQLGKKRNLGLKSL